jgi:hypothetical protein
MHTAPAFDVYRNEIRANRPLISFVPGHSRTVAGYTRDRFVLVGQSRCKEVGVAREANPSG